MVVPATYVTKKEKLIKIVKGYYRYLLMMRIFCQVGNLTYKKNIRCLGSEVDPDDETLKTKRRHENPMPPYEFSAIKYTKMMIITPHLVWMFK